MVTTNAIGFCQILNGKASAIGFRGALAWLPPWGFYKATSRCTALIKVSRANDHAPSA